MTKHELLDYIANKGSVTLYEISKSFNVTHQYVSERMKMLARCGNIKLSSKINNKKRGQPIKVFEITDIGLRKLKHFDNFDCKNPNCSCKS